MKKVNATVLFAIALPVTAAAAGILVIAILNVIGLGSGAAFVGDMQTGSNAAVGHARMFTYEVDFALIPIVLALIALSIGRYPPAWLGLIVSSLGAAVIAGEPSPMRTIYLAILYSVVAFCGRCLSRKIWPRRNEDRQD